MKKVSNLLFVFATLVIAISCNNSGKENVKAADSANDAKTNTDTSSATLQTDDKSSSFLVRVADAGMGEVELTKLAEEKSTNAEIKGFASMLWNDHTQLNQQVKQMAQERNVTLPPTTSEDHNKVMADMKTRSGKNFEKEFLDKLVVNHNKSISLFEDAIKEVNDAAVRTFADNTLPKLRVHRDSAQALKKKYW